MVRVAGLYVTFNGLTSLVGVAMAALLPAFKVTPGGPVATMAAGMGGAMAGVALFAILMLAMGLWLLRGAPQLMAYAYGDADLAPRPRTVGTQHEARA